MKAIIEFDLPEEHNEYRLHTNAPDMFSALLDIDSYMRTIRKGWENPTIDELEEKISEIINNSKIYEIE